MSVNSKKPDYVLILKVFEDTIKHFSQPGVPVEKYIRDCLSARIVLRYKHTYDKALSTPQAWIKYFNTVKQQLGVQIEYNALDDNETVFVQKLILDKWGKSKGLKLPLAVLCYYYAHICDDELFNIAAEDIDIEIFGTTFEQKFEMKVPVSSEEARQLRRKMETEPNHSEKYVPNEINLDSNFQDAQKYKTSHKLVTGTSNQAFRTIVVGAALFLVLAFGIYGWQNKWLFASVSTELSNDKQISVLGEVSVGIRVEINGQKSNDRIADGQSLNNEILHLEFDLENASEPILSSVYKVMSGYNHVQFAGTYVLYPGYASGSMPATKTYQLVGENLGRFIIEFTSCEGNCELAQQRYTSQSIFTGDIPIVKLGDMLDLSENSIISFQLKIMN